MSVHSSPRVTKVLMASLIILALSPLGLAGDRGPGPRFVALPKSFRPDGSKEFWTRYVSGWCCVSPHWMVLVIEEGPLSGSVVSNDEVEQIRTADTVAVNLKRRGVFLPKPCRTRGKPFRGPSGTESLWNGRTNERRILEASFAGVGLADRASWRDP